MLHILNHSFFDTIKILPFIFVIYLLIEFFEHKNNTFFSHTLMKSKKSGAFAGALLGSVPQCGFSVIASDLFSKRAISLGTLISIFIATSDEAIPVLLSETIPLTIIGKIVFIKIIIAFICGFLIDCLYKNKNPEAMCKNQEHHEHYHGNCEKCEGGVIKSAVVHTIKIFVYIFVFTFLFSVIIDYAGEEYFSRFLLKNSPLEPFFASLAGLFPNCASSVILTQAYLDGVISFGSFVGGLSSGAGVGLVILFKKNKNLKENLLIVLLLLFIGTVSGIILR